MAGNEANTTDVDRRAAIANESGLEVWPPPPFDPADVARPVPLPTATPSQTFRFFLLHCSLYGVVSGMLYGAGVGVFLYIVGAVYGFVIGGAAGLLLGIVDGLVIGLYGYRARRRAVPPDVVERTVRFIGSVLTYIGGFTICACLSHGIWDAVCNPFVHVVCVAAVIASSDAARRMMRKYNQRYAQML